MSFVFHRLSVDYAAAAVLREVCGEVLAGRLTALIGPNGSGKSTLIKTLAGLQPYAGFVELDRREVRTIPRRDMGRLVAVVPQQPSIAAPFCVYDVVALGRLPYQGLLRNPGEEDDAKVVSAAERTEIRHLLFRDATTLSGGESQRVLLAAALAQDTPHLLLDEPTSALDPGHTKKMLSLSRQCAESGKTVLAALHDVNLAVEYADDFLALKRGSVLASGPVASIGADLLENLYETPFTAYISSEGATAWHAR